MVQSDYRLTGALERLFRQHSRELFVSALAVTGCPSSAEDAVQEAFYRLFRMRRRPLHLKAYVFRSVRNAAIDQFKVKSTGRIEDDEYIFDGAAGPEQAAVNNEFRRQVIEGLKMLSGDERETIISHLFADLSFREIGRVREVSINTVW